MALVLTRCKFQATYKPVTKDFIVHDNFDGAVGLWQALRNAGVALPATGAKLSFSVQYADRSSTQTAEKRAAFEVGEYEVLSNGRLKLVGNPETSSKGVAPVDWSEGERELVFLSAVPGSVINLLTEEKPNEEFLGLTTTNIPINTQAKNVKVVVSNEVTFAPKIPSRSVVGMLSAYTNINWSSATNLGFKLLLESYDGSSWVSRDVGYYLNNSSSTNRVRQKISYQPVLVTERHNDLVRLRVAAELLYDNLELHVSAASLHMRELH